MGGLLIEFISVNTQGIQILKAFGQCFFRKERMAFISDCLQLTQLAHIDQPRTSGQPYEEHPLAVYRIYRSVCPRDDLGQGVCLLHDVVENSSITLAALASFLGGEVALMVDAVSKRDPREFRCQEARIRDYYSRFFSAAQKNPRIALVKLVDRYHNVSTIDALSYERAAKTLSETERVLLPFFRLLNLPLTDELASLCLHQRASLSHCRGKRF